MAKNNKIVLDLTIDGIDATKSQIDGLVASMSNLKTKITDLESKKVLTQNDIDKLDRYKKSMSENIQKHSELTTTLTNQQRALSANIESTTRLEKAQKASASVANAQKTAFEAVSKSIGLASVSTSELVKTLLNLKIPSLNFDGVGQSAMAQVTAITRQASGFGNERISTEQFTQIAKAAYGTKDTIEEVTLAVQQFREIMENTSGANAFTANSAALIGLQNQIKATGGSVSAMNKEISNIQNTFGNAPIKSFSAMFVQFDDILQDFNRTYNEIDIENFSSRIEVAQSKLEDFNYAFSKAITELDELEQERDKRLNAVKNLAAEINTKEGLGLDVSSDMAQLNVLEQGLNEAEQAISNSGAQAFKDFSNSIVGLNGQLSLLVKEYNSLSNAQRSAVQDGDTVTYGDKLLERIKEITTELDEAEKKLNSVGATTQKQGKQLGGDLHFLTNSMSQVARELPNFFISPQIGFMAISNNLPILAEAWTQYKTNVEAAGGEMKSFGKVALESLTSLPGLMVILSGAFIAFGDTAIKYIIDKLNEIPKSLEIELSIYEKTGDAIKTYLEKVNDLKNDIRVLNTLYGKSHSTRLAEIKEKMVNEKIATKEELANIKAKDLANSEYFKRYIKYQTDLAFNQEIFKKKAENEAKMEVLKASLIATEDTLVKNSVRKGMSSQGGGKVVYTIMGDRRTFDTRAEAEASAKDGVLGHLREVASGERNNGDYEWLNNLLQTNEAQKWLDITREINKLAPDMRELNKIKLRDVFKPLDKKEDGGRKASSSEVTPGLITVDSLKDIKKNNDIWTDYEKQLPKDMEFVVNQLHQQDLNNKQRIEGYDKWYFSNLNKNAMMENEMAQKLEEKKRMDLGNEQLYYQDKKQNLTKWLEDNKTLEEDYIKFREAFKLRKDALDDAGETLSSTKKVLEGQKSQLEAIEVEMKKSKDKKRKAELKDEYNKLAEQLQIKNKAYNEEVVLYNEQVEAFKTYTDKKADLEKRLKKGEDVSVELEATNTKLTQIGSAIVESQKTTAELVRDNWNIALDATQGYINGVGTAFNSTSGIMDNLMKMTANAFQAERNELELSDTYRKASSEQQEEMIYQLELRKYEATKRDFEVKKWADAGSAIIAGLTSEVLAVKNLIGNGGAISPIAWGAFAMETALITTTTIANVGEIMSRKLEKPIPPKKSSASKSGGGGGNGGTAPSVALTPNKDSLTSTTEILNSKTTKQQTNVVKVSEINDVQKKVEVRDNLSKY